MGQRVADECLRHLQNKSIKEPTITILGVTFKENVPDIRNSKVFDIARALGKAGIHVQMHDPLVSAEEARHECGIALCSFDALRPADAVIFAGAQAACGRG